jgi:hypothetical protein
MNTWKTIFSQLMDFLSPYEFRQCGRTDCCTAPDPCEFDLDTDGDVDVIDLRLFIEDYGRAQN